MSYLDSAWLTSLAFALIPVNAEPALGQVADVSPLDQRANLTIRHRHRGTFTEKSSHRRLREDLIISYSSLVSLLLLRLCHTHMCDT